MHRWSLGFKMVQGFNLRWIAAESSEFQETCLEKKAAFQAPPWCLDRLSGSEWLVLQSMAVWPLKKKIKNVSYLFDPFCAPRLSLPWEYLSWHGRAEVTWWLRPETSRWTRPAWRCPFDQDRGPAVPLCAAPWIELVSKNMVGFLRWGSPKPINTIGFNTKMI